MKTTPMKLPLTRAAHSAIKYLLCATTLFMLTSCDALKEGYDQGVEMGFHKTFRFTFIQSCKKGAEDANDKNLVEKLCTCVADELLTNLSVEELQDQDKMTQYISDVAIKKCKNPKAATANDTPSAVGDGSKGTSSP